MRRAAMVIVTITSIHLLLISPNTEEISSAVAIYLAISISHFPNSLFILQSYAYFPKLFPNRAEKGGKMGGGWAMFLR